MTAIIPHWISGRACSAAPGRTAPVFNPATGETAAAVPLAGAGEVEQAVASAAAAAPEWGRTSLSRRTEILFRFRELVARNLESLADTVVREHGKVLSDARGEVRRGLDVVEFACGIPHLLKGQFSENVSADVDSYSIRQPLGVVAGITPFNFPVMVPMWMFPIAIACGNAFVLKPSERDPSASLMLAELLREAGLQDGVLNVVHGDREAVEAILAHPAIRAVSFVGSTAVARHIYETGTRHGKRVQALGGAKNHMVVMPDADLDQAADAAVSAAYGSAGERCMAISVVVAVGAAGDRLVPKIVERLGAIRVGDGRDPESDMGPLITREHRDRVAGYLDRGAAEGATVVVDGRRLTVTGRDFGFFLGPSLIDRVTPAMTVYQDEIFGPVLSIVRAGSFEEARDLINANPYANGVAVFTSDGGTARRFQSEVEVGMVGINVPIPVPMAYYSFGGWKSSLFGDAHVYGEDGVRFYTRTKVVTARWPARPPAGGADLSFPMAR
ncbi:MAG TPA: CoA-acylating methylmalonate-semialdehyde dehydrogenase [Gemmatimonadales bacterium]|nr:CoA-acylating methylmalonate-semialdehyde dehydrogenase [Gemmatimonadales bacterium]